MKEKVVLKGPPNEGKEGGGAKKSSKSGGGTKKKKRSGQKNEDSVEEEGDYSVVGCVYEGMITCCCLFVSMRE